MKAALTPQARQRLRDRVEDVKPHQPEIAEVLGVLLDESERWDAIAAALVKYERRVEEMERDRVLANLTARLEMLERHAEHRGELFGPEEPADWEEPETPAAPVIPAPKPVAFVDEDGRFHCPCGRSHKRGAVDGVDLYRCLNCGKGYRVRGIVELRNPYRLQPMSTLNVKG